jgi:hypothetical protein
MARARPGLHSSAHRIERLGRLFARARDLVMLDGKTIFRHAFALGLNDMGKRRDKSQRTVPRSNGYDQSD